MASLLCSTSATVQQNPRILCFSPLKSISQVKFFSLTKRLKSNPGRCNAFFGSIPDDLLEQSLSQFPVIMSGFVKLETITGELTEVQKWGFIVFAGVIWIYLTARPGVVVGAIDAYLLAPLQLGLDSLTGRRSLKRSDFLVGDKLGEGSFGIVYSGVIVPKNVPVEERLPKRGGRKTLDMDCRLRIRSFSRRLKLVSKGLKNVEIMRNGLITGFQEQLLRHVLSS